MKKSLLLPLAITAIASSSAFAIQDGVYGEVGVGATALTVTANEASESSDAELLLRAGVGYRAHFAKTSPIFWGVDAHVNNYNGDYTTIDAAAMIGADLSKYISLYAKVGADYAIVDGLDSSDAVFPKFGVGVNYCISQNASIALEASATHLAGATINIDDANVGDVDVNIFRSDVSLGFQYKF